ncbi:hypothetical protein [Flavobacterium dankookense]|uniref:Uncharacterized protein n=1 Tax=Flavobacterium dankookense TaxID=706186 RepID=A0A4R6QE57_9FLAO|nr:hypothetical protein [Flavobacterium dankookense]TDP60675.1 hypothetical protein BC748_0271 [Flavobacterium dankookense]
MLINKVNLEKELISERKKFKSEMAILEDVKAIFAENEIERELIKQTLQEKSSTKTNQLKFDLLETDKIFHLEQIKKICIDYRFRFLDSSIFKNEIPEEAISKIRNLEKKHDTKLEGFKIVAPSKAFLLENYDDPLLFIPMGNDYFYLIHQWGNDMNSLRKWIVKPVKNISNFVITCVVVSLFLTVLTPSTELSKTVPMASLIIFLFIFKSIVAVTAYYFFMMGKNFNSEIWQRKYYNN